MNGIEYSEFAHAAEVTCCWYSAKEVPEELKCLMLQNDPREHRYRDYFTPLNKGKAWLFELTAKHQPLTAAALQAGGELCLRCVTLDDGGLELALCMESSAQTVVISRGFSGMNASDESYMKPREDRSLSLPLALREAYYTRFDGLDMPENTWLGIHTRLLPFPIYRPWVSWDRFLEAFKGYKSQYLAWLEARIPGVTPQRKNAPWTNFMAFLDTRPTLSGKEGDVLFVKNHVQDGVVYWVCDADIENMRVLADPVAALDHYCEHVLLGRAGRFDFMPYSVPM